MKEFNFSFTLWYIVWRNLQVSQYPHNSVRTNFQLYHFMRSSFMHTYWSQAQSSLYVSYLQGPLSSAHKSLLQLHKCIQAYICFKFSGCLQKKQVNEIMRLFYNLHFPRMRKIFFFTHF